MIIKSIDVKYYHADSLYSACEGLKHTKILPFLSVVQSCEGSYDVILNNSEPFHTEKGGIFIAPSTVVQNPTHHVDPDTGFMKAHWVFLDVLINETYRLDHLFHFPVILSEIYQQKVKTLLSNLQLKQGLCLDLSYIYQLLDILLQIAVPKNKTNEFTQNSISYINQHYSEKIDITDLAIYLNLSPSSVFRKFKQEFHKTPANYINEIRLSHASVLLETESSPIANIASTVGFDDVFYFSKLFKKKFGISPSVYRNKLRINTKH